MAIKDYILEGSQWSQADDIGNLTPEVGGGYCRALVIYWLNDVNTNHKVTVTENFRSLIKSHAGNLKGIAQSQADTSKVGGLNGLDMVTVHLMQVSQGTLSVNTAAANVTWFSAGGGSPGSAVRNALNQSVKSMCIVHLEWDGWFGTSVGSGAHAIGAVSEPGGSAGLTYTIFDPNYGILRAYGTAGVDALMLDIQKDYSASRLMAMPLM